MERSPQRANIEDKKKAAAEAVPPMPPTPETMPPAFSAPPAAPTPETTPAPFKRMAAEKEAQRAGRLGFDSQPDLKRLVAKGSLDTLGSVFGFRFAWEAPKLVKDYFSKKENKGKISESAIALLEASQTMKNPEKAVSPAPGRAGGQAEKISEGKKVAEEKGPVASKIKELNERLKDVKMPAQEKSAMRKEMAEILKQYRSEDGKLEEARTEKVGKVLDLYINNSAQQMVVVREALNTVSVMTMMPWMRSIGYTGLAIAERASKAAENYDKKHFKEGPDSAGKLKEVVRNLTVDAAKETYNGLIGNFFGSENAGKTKMQKGAEFASSAFKLMRVIGIAEFEHSVQSGSLAAKEGAQKFWTAVSDGNFGGALKQGGENWVVNAQRLLSYVGLSENPSDAMRKLVAGREAEAEKIHVDKLKEIFVEKEKIKELATIHKSEGVTHALVRQFEHNPTNHGFKGDFHDKVALHRWAQHEAYRSAVKNGYINVATGEEHRVLDNAKSPSAYILKSDGKIEALNKHEYLWNPQKEIHAEIERAQKVNTHLKEIYQWKWGPFHGNQYEEWQTVKNIKASDALGGKFGNHVGQQFDMVEGHNRRQMQEYLKELHDKTKLQIKNDETVEEYIRRANKVRSLDVRVTGTVADHITAPHKEKIESAVSGHSEKTEHAKVIESAFSVKKIFEGSGGSKLVFEYTEKGDIIKMQPGNNYDFRLHAKELSGNWRVMLLDILKKEKVSLPMDSSLQKMRLETQVSSILQMKNTLEKLDKNGLNSSKEAEFLRDHLKNYLEIFRK